MSGKLRVKTQHPNGNQLLSRRVPGRPSTVLYRRLIDPIREEGRHMKPTDVDVSESAILSRMFHSRMPALSP